MEVLGHMLYAIRQRPYWPHFLWVEQCNARWQHQRNPSSIYNHNISRPISPQRSATSTTGCRKMAPPPASSKPQRWNSHGPITDRVTTIINFQYCCIWTENAICFLQRIVIRYGKPASKIDRPCYRITGCNRLHDTHYASRGDSDVVIRRSASITECSGLCIQS